MIPGCGLIVFCLLIALARDVYGLISDRRLTR